MSIRFLSVMLAAVALSVSVSAHSAEKEEFSAKCIVSGAPAKEASSVAYRGKKLYFCCDNCPKAYKKTPEKFTAKAHHQLLSTKQITMVACPLTGRPLNEDIEVTVGDLKVNLCCKGCQGKVNKADKDAAVELVFAKFDKGFTLQTDCPVSGQPIKADKFVEYKGQKVYFCCPGCPGAFEKNPEKFADKVPQLVEAEKEKKKS